MRVGEYRAWGYSCEKLGSCLREIGTNVCWLVASASPDGSVRESWHEASGSVHGFQVQARHRQHFLLIPLFLFAYIVKNDGLK